MAHDVGSLISDEEVIQRFPMAASEEVPPRPNHVVYDLRIPSFAGKLEVLGDPRWPLLWFTWAKPNRPIQGGVAGKPWIWVEQGPIFWIIDLWFDREQLSARQAAKIAMNMGLSRGIVEPGEGIIFWRNTGRYGQMTVRGG